MALWKVMLLFYIIFVVLPGPYLCQAPTIWGVPSQIAFLEDIPIGSVLFSFNATVDVENEDISVKPQGPEASAIARVNQSRGNDIRVQIVTKTKLDRDGYGIPGKGSVHLMFMVSDLRGNVISFETTLYLFDVNDNQPKLQNQPYNWDLKERFHYGNETYHKVTANDLDSGGYGNAGMRYKMEPIAQSESMALEYRQTFAMNAYTGVITLLRALDYETHNIYLFNVTATDNNGNGTTSVASILTIKVLDVQDTPPFFTSVSYKAFLPDKAVVNTRVTSVYALDGDTGYTPLNALEYSIKTGPCSAYFRIDNHGEIRTTKPINTNTDAFERSCELTVVAQEVDVDPSTQYGSTRAETTVYVVLESQESHPWICSKGTQLNAVMSICIAAVIMLF